MLDNYPSSLDGSLSNEIILSYDGVIGCPEKSVIAKHMKVANCFRLDDDIEGAVGWLSSSVKSDVFIMQNAYDILSVITGSGNPVWIEFNYDSRYSYIVRSYDNKNRTWFEGSKMGYLFIPDLSEDGSSVLSIITIWKKDEKIFTNPCVNHIDMQHLKLLASSVDPGFWDRLIGRRYNKASFAGIGGDVMLAILETSRVTVMNGMVEDTKIIHNVNAQDAEKYVSVCKYLCVSELPFAMYSFMFVLMNPKYEVTCPGNADHRLDGSLVWYNGKKPKQKTFYGILTPEITGQVSG